MAIVGKWFGFMGEEILDEGITSFERGDDEGAVEALEEYLLQHPRSESRALASFHLANASARLAQVYLESGRAPMARPLIERAVTLAPTYPDLRIRAGLIYRELGEFDQEAVSVGEALLLNPGYRAAVCYQIALLYRSGNHEEAMTRLSTAIARDPGLASERSRYAVQANAEGAFPRALSNLEAMITEADSDANLHVRLGNSFLRGQMFAEAADEFAKASELAPEYPDVRCRHGQALVGLGRNEEAIEEFRRAIELNPAYADAYAYLGVVLRHESLDLDAEAAFQRALELNPAHRLASAHADLKAG